MRRSIHLLLAVVGGLFHAACLPQDGTGTSSNSSSSGGASGTTGDSGAATAAGRACIDTVDAFAKASQRCGEDYAAARAATLRELANGDCDSVTVRNETELRTRCFPSLANIRCVDLTNQRFDPSCAGQIIRSR